MWFRQPDKGRLAGSTPAPRTIFTTRKIKALAIVQGKARYCKILGKPQEGYDPGEENREWNFDLVVSKEVEAGLPEYMKIREDEKTGDRYITFKRKAYKKDGTAAKPIAVVDDKGREWDRDVMIGNGSTLNVLYDEQEWTFGRKSGTRASVIKVQVWDHVPYKGKEDLPIREDEPKPLAADGEVWN